MPLTNIKPVKILKKYIPPQFTVHKLKLGTSYGDGFRTNELCKPGEHCDYTYRIYSSNDIPAKPPADIYTLDRIRVSPFSGENYIESNLPYYVDILGTNKRVYLENYGTKNPKHPHVVMAGDEYPGLTVDQVVNIKYYIKNLSLDTFAKKYAYEWLREGLPLEGIINLMKSSCLKKRSGETTAANYRLFRFLTQYPKSRHCVVGQFKNGGEYLDDIAAEKYFCTSRKNALRTMSILDYPPLVGANTFSDILNGYYSNEEIKDIVTKRRSQVLKFWNGYNKFVNNFSHTQFSEVLERL